MLKSLKAFLGRRGFAGSTKYWEHRYASGGTSGHGSYGDYAQFKAEFLNKFVVDHGINSVIEFGCGDGNQLSLANYPNYIGVDISSTAIKLCTQRFHGDTSKKFYLANQRPTVEADLAISLDVTYHLTEDGIFSQYMLDLFNSARRFVVIYSSDPGVSSRPQPHVLHRPISNYVAEHFTNWHFGYSAKNPFPEHPTENFAKFIVFSTMDNTIS